jgi:signal transduction histidine kinase
MRRRFALAASLPALLALATMALLADRLARRALEDELGARLVAVAQATAASLPSEEIPVTAAGSAERRGRLEARLSTLARATGTRLALLRPDGLALADSEGRARAGARIPGLEDDHAELARAAEGTATASGAFREGAEGLLRKTGYAPLFGAEGRVVAVVAAEGAAASDRTLRAFRRLLATLAVAGAVVGAVVAAIAGLNVVRPLMRLTEAAQRIARGDLETPIWKRKRRDQIKTLRDTMEEMRQALRARDEERETLLAGIAHEVRNPLGGMDLFTGILAEELAGRPEAAHAARVRSELANLERVVDEFLDFARARPLDLAPVDLGSLAAEVRDLALPLALDRGVRLAVSGAGEAPGDRERLRRAVLNLARNAIEASPAGATVEIAARAEGDQAEVEVRDRGPGLSAGARERLFRPFFTTKEKGTGLGLALAKKVTDAHGGTLAVEARPGGGTVARVTLPTGRAP